MKRHEVVRLRNEHPDLYRRALAIEERANGPDGINKSPRGLSGRPAYFWSDIVRDDDAQAKLWDFWDQVDESPTPCGCYDG